MQVTKQKLREIIEQHFHDHEDPESLYFDAISSVFDLLCGDRSFWDQLVKDELTKDEEVEIVE